MRAILRSFRLTFHLKLKKELFASILFCIAHSNRGPFGDFDGRSRYRRSRLNFYALSTKEKDNLILYIQLKRRIFEVLRLLK